jgi:hypothetical protein
MVGIRRAPLRRASRGNTVKVWLGTIQAQDADEVYICQRAHRSIPAADNCAAREAKRRAGEDRCRAHDELRRQTAEWRERLGLDRPVTVKPLSVTRTLEEARRLGHLVTPGLAWSSWLVSAWWTDCEQRRAPYVVVNLQRGRYAQVECSVEAAYVQEVSEEQQEPLHWLARSFTAVGGEYWYGVTSGSDRCPRDRAAEFAVRLAALGRQLVAGAYVAR